MKLKGIFICLCLLSLVTLATPAWAQAGVPPGTIEEERPQQYKDHVVNFGIKGGFNSSLFLISGFSINDVAIEEVQNNYKIGYFGSLFMRINFDHHFLQPEVSYNINRCNITFDRFLSSDPDTEPRSIKASITSSIHSVDFPVIYGYNIIKEGPYSLAVFGGPKVRYILGKKSDIEFEGFSQEGIREQLRPFNLSFTTGVSVTISRVFFDFRYDIGLHNISKSVTYDTSIVDYIGDETLKSGIHFRRRDNVLSFSFGVFF